MIIRCPNCDTAYNLDKEAISNGGRKVRCKRCSHVFWARSVAGPGGEGSVEIFYKEPYNPPSKLQRPAAAAPNRGTMMGLTGQAGNRIGQPAPPAAARPQVDSTRGQMTALGIGSISKDDEATSEDGRVSHTTSLGFDFSPAASRQGESDERTTGSRPVSRPVSRPLNPSTKFGSQNTGSAPQNQPASSPLRPTASKPVASKPAAPSVGADAKPKFGQKSSFGAPSSSSQPAKKVSPSSSNESSVNYAPFDLDGFFSSLKSQDFKEAFASPEVSESDLKQLNQKIERRSAQAMPLNDRDREVARRLRAKISGGDPKAAAPAAPSAPSVKKPVDAEADASPVASPTFYSSHAPLGPSPFAKKDPAPSAPSLPPQPAQPSEPPSTRSTIPPTQPAPTPFGSTGPSPSLGAPPMAAPRSQDASMSQFGAERATGAPLEAPDFVRPPAGPAPGTGPGRLDSETVEFDRQEDAPHFQDAFQTGHQPAAAPVAAQSPPAHFAEAPTEQLSRSPDLYVDPTPPTEIMDVQHQVLPEQKKKSGFLLGFIIFLIVFLIAAAITYYVVVNVL